jgi:ribulose-5-phosphate 4-epimerase/fuculose-1-phosphate aldolase
MDTTSLKEDLALCYQILAHLGLDDHTYTHLSARSENGFYIHPFGLHFKEVRASNLLEVSLEGEVLNGTELIPNPTGYVIHSQVYKNNHDINAVFHLHTPEIVAVSALKKGLLPISQWALHFYNKISYHDYDSLALQTDQGACLAKDLGRNFTLLMRNHGSLTCGKTLHEALFYTHHLQLACKAQCLALSMKEELSLPSTQVCEKSVEDLLSFEADLGLRDFLAWKRLLVD